MCTREEAERTVRIANVLVEPAHANHDIQGHLSDSTPPQFWTVEGVRSNPTCRVEQVHVKAIGGIGESLAAARHKNWVEFI